MARLYNYNRAWHLLTNAQKTEFLFAQRRGWIWYYWNDHGDIVLRRDVGPTGHRLYLRITGSGNLIPASSTIVC